MPPCPSVLYAVTVGVKKKMIFLYFMESSKGTKVYVKNKIAYKASICESSLPEEKLKFSNPKVVFSLSSTTIELTITLLKKQNDSSSSSYFHIVINRK